MRPRRLEITQSGATRDAVAVHALTTTAAAILALLLAWSLADHLLSLSRIFGGF